MRLLVLQHVPFEGPAAIADWAAEHQYPISYINCAEQPTFPATADYDLLIIMGGPMGVNDALPWITDELRFIKQAIAANKRILGVCLGAQMIASAMSAAVRKHHQREIGWFDVERVANAEKHSRVAAKLPERFTPLHWHGDTFEIPKGATHLYQSAACANQAFSVDDRIIGLQFHLEFDQGTAERVGAACQDELEEGGNYVQSMARIIESRDRFTTANQLMFTLLDALTGNIR